MDNIFTESSFSISLEKLKHEHYLKLVNYLNKQKVDGESSSSGVHDYFNKERVIFKFEASSVSNLPPIYHDIKISVVSGQKFEKGKVEKAVHGLIKLLTKLEKE